MSETTKEVIIAVLATILVMLFFGAGASSFSDMRKSRIIQECINAGNKPIPCVQATLGLQN